MINRTTELEEKLDKMEEEKFKSEMALTECQRQLETLRSQLKEADAKMGELQDLLTLANESRQAREEEIKRSDSKRKETESQLRIAEAEIKTLLSKIVSLDAEVEKERALSAENTAKSQEKELAVAANLLDSDKSSDVSSEESKDHENGERWRLDLGNQSSGRDSEAIEVTGGALRLKNGGDRESSLSLNSSFVSEKTRSGFGKFFPRGQSRARNEN
ncbi:hypothetical protein NC652_015150 [Populus alba x Populus x berolinensis]|nr:hypothetical protein NC652_015150 [Populus alba x Populus x berolinensis]